MDAGRYFPTNPGPWNQLDRLTRDILFLDLSHTGWLNVSLSGARGKLNSRVDTVITLPNLALTHRLFSTQSYPHMPKNRRPQETSIEERRLSTHYELQKSVPPGRWEEEEPENWDRPFERGFFVQVGQKGQRPIDTDFAVRISKQSRIKLSTTVHEAHSQAHVNNVALTYGLDGPLTCAEMGFTTANELFFRFVRRVRSTISIGADFYSKHYPATSKEPVNGVKPTGTTTSHVCLGARWSNLTSSNQPIPPGNAEMPYELTVHANLLNHYGVSGCIKPLGGDLAIAASFKRQWTGPRKKWSVALQYSNNRLVIPSTCKLTISSHVGVAAFVGIRLEKTLGLGLGMSIDPTLSVPRAAIFIDL